jgi:acetylornithine deacetylase/succinyl-diaminopimelate desuccinylase-like protein
LKELFAHIDSHAEEYIEELKQLCRQPSVSAQNLGLDEMANLCARSMRAHGLDTRMLSPGDGPPVVYGECKGSKSRTLLVYHHYDVQPPEPLYLWESPPYEPEVREGKLFGRGVVDNKGALMTRLAAVKACLDVYGALPISIKFFVEGEEEVGSPHLLHLLQTQRDLLMADACLWSGEVNWQHRPQIALGLKGMLYVELEARGANQDLISSRGTSVVNPAWRLVWALSTLKDADENVLIAGFAEHARPPSDADLAALRGIPFEEQREKDALGIDEFLMGLSGMELQARDLFSPSCSICGIVTGYTGPGAKTILPSVARAKLDFRLVPDMKPEDILLKLRCHLDKRGFGDISIATIGKGKAAWRTPLDHPFVETVVEAARESSGREPIVLPMMNASGNMSLFGQLLNIPIAMAGIRYPGSCIHAPNENVRLEDFIMGIKHVAAILKRMGQNEKERKPR